MKWIIGTHPMGTPLPMTSCHTHRTIKVTSKIHTPVATLQVWPPTQSHSMGLLTKDIYLTYFQRRMWPQTSKLYKRRELIFRNIYAFASGVVLLWMLGPETTLWMVRKILQPMTSVYWVFLKVNTWNRTTHGKGKRMQKPEPEKGVFSCMCSVLFEVTWVFT